MMLDLFEVFERIGSLGLCMIECRRLCKQRIRFFNKHRQIGKSTYVSMKDSGLVEERMQSSACTQPCCLDQEMRLSES